MEFPRPGTQVEIEEGKQFMPSFDLRFDGDDESTLCPDLFLSGPMLHHREAIFCFIYKSRGLHCGAHRPAPVAADESGLGTLYSEHD